VHDNGFLGGIDGDLALGADEAGVAGRGVSAACGGWRGVWMSKLLRSGFQVDLALAQGQHGVAHSSVIAVPALMAFVKRGLHRAEGVRQRAEGVHDRGGLVGRVLRQRQRLRLDRGGLVGRVLRQRQRLRLDRVLQGRGLLAASLRQRQRLRQRLRSIASSRAAVWLARPA
jgi:hypothetical protein